MSAARAEGPLEGVVAKIQRASSHLEALYAEVRTFVESEPKPHGFVSKVDVETSRYIALVRIYRPPPVEFSLIAGDFIQNLRAALDHLVWQMVKANGQTPGNRNAFPIFDQRPSNKRGNRDRERWNAMTRGLHPAAERFIELCQPYNGPDGPRAHSLAALRRLSNEDKHRTLLAAYNAIESRPDRFDLDVVGVRDVRSPVERAEVYAGRPLNDYDLVLTAPVVITGPSPEVELKGQLPIDVGFGNPPVPLEALKQMVHQIATLAVASRVHLGV